jgi:hypothetical protein
LMLLEARTMKDKQFKYMVDLTIQTKDGKLSMQTKQERSQQKVLTKNSVLRSTVHST